jgi:hypothetical protein
MYRIQLGVFMDMEEDQQITFLNRFNDLGRILILMQVRSFKQRITAINDNPVLGPNAKTIRMAEVLQEYVGQPE